MTDPQRAEASRIFHFVFGLREQFEPFHILHYLCLASCFAVNHPDAIHFHYRHEPFGPWWERIKPRLHLHRVSEPVAGFAPERYLETEEGRLIERLGLHYAHESDFLRLDILIAEGGAYADMDTLFVRPFPDQWFTEAFVIGEENSPQTEAEIIRPSLCNALMLAQPQSRFALLWRQRMNSVFDGTWSRHSCVEAARVWQTIPECVRVLPSVYFFRHGASVAGFHDLFDLPAALHADADIYSIHLWAHLWWDDERTDFSPVHAAQIDEAWIRTRNCTVAQHARQFL